MPDPIARAARKATSIGPDPNAEFLRQFGGLAMGAIGPDDLAPFLKSLGRPLADLLDMVLTTKGAGGLPKRLKFTGWHPRTGRAQLHPPNAPVGPAPYETSLKDLDALLSKGTIDLEQPPARATADIQRRLRAILDDTLGEYADPKSGKPLWPEKLKRKGTP